MQCGRRPHLQQSFNDSLKKVNEMIVRSLVQNVGLVSKDDGLSEGSSSSQYMHEVQFLMPKLGEYGFGLWPKEDLHEKF